MALTAYQTQFKRRKKRTIKLRAKSDKKARRYTQLLADAIGTAEDAATQMNELNQLYNVDVSTYTLLTQGLPIAGRRCWSTIWRKVRPARNWLSSTRCRTATAGSPCLTTRFLAKQ